MRPLFRWTLGGPTTQVGEEVFRESIRWVMRVYRDSDFVVCYNNRSRPTYLEGFVDLYEQPAGDNQLWKFSPVRLRPDGPEIWISPTVVIRKNIRELDYWLAKRSPGAIIASAPSRAYGFLDHSLPAINLSDAFFGFSPNVDLTLMSQQSGRQLSPEDERGLVAMAVLGVKPRIVIPLERLPSLAHGLHYPIPGAINFSVTNHGAWTMYKSLTDWSGGPLTRILL